MLIKIKSYSKSLLVRIQPIAGYLKKRSLKRKFNVELDLINGRHHNENAYPSIIHFSLNKAATQYTKSILNRCAIENGMQPVNIHGYAFNTDFPFLDHLSAEEMKKYHHIFKQNGYLYSVFGGMIEGIPNLEKYKVLLMVRDPRDILVSGFYSIAYSHSTPDKQGNKYEKFMEQRAKARGSTIDKYVIAESDKVYNIFLRYKNLLIDIHPTVCVITYEQMVDDFQVWLKDTLEDIHKHIRKGKAGDYMEKLNSETIEHLNTKFSSILDALGYKQDSIS